MPVTEQQIVTTLLRERLAILTRIDAVLGDIHQAEDVLQDLSLAALDKRDSIEDLDHLRHWLRKVARDMAVDVIRRAGRRPAVLDASVLDRLETHWQRFDGLEAAEVQQILQHCIQQLSPYNRQLIEQRYRNNLTGRSLAEALGRPVNTVKVALTRAHRTLLNCLRRRLQHDAPHA
ncbi:sigma-70 family RNA polymerase sigma factor [Planctomycetales bacterium ZRK34]|nr:sigma-70 family RNA polymerase sigma factor [Planctomycetales bacterium ZRK34]